nr:zinc finger, CCHC-type [Tanacetum cinerariifolium]
MGDENSNRPCTLGDYYRPIHEGYRNAIELPEGAKVSPLRSDTIRLVQNGCEFHRLMYKDLIQHLKDFPKIVDFIDLNGATRNTTPQHEEEEWNDLIFSEKEIPDYIDATLEQELESLECRVESLMRNEVLLEYEENKLEYEDEDEVEIKMMGTGMDKKSLEHNLYENDITPIMCHNFSPTSNPPIKLKDSGSFRMKVVEPLTIHTPPSPHVAYLYRNVSSCSTFKVHEKTQLSRSKCMHSLREVKSLFKFLSETSQDFGTMPIFKRTFSQDLDLLEQHLTKDILTQTDCNTTLTNLKTKFENAFNSEFRERMRKYTRFDAQSFKDAMIFNMDSIGKYMLEIILHQQRTLHLLKQKKLMQTQEDHSNPILALNVDSLKVDSVVIQNTCSEKEDSNSETAFSKSVKECNLDSAIKDVHAIKYKMSKAKERCMAYFRSLHSHLQVLFKEDLKGTRIEHGFKWAFMSLIGQDVDTFTSIMLLNVDRLQKQLDKDEFQEDGSMTAFWVVKHFRDTLLQHMGNVKKSVAERARHQRHGIESEVQDNSRSGNDTDVDDVDIRPIYDEEPMDKTNISMKKIKLLKSSAVTTADTSDKRQQQPDATSSTLTLATTVTAGGNFDM